VSLVPTGWATAEGPVETVVDHGQSVTVRLGSRAYFASTCTAGTYDNAQYLALDLRGKTFKYTTDLSGAGCGCNAALYLTSMHQNEKPSECGDHYCDANNVCGESCSEIDIQEGNQYSWHSTLHSSQDHAGLGKGYGGGGPQWSGPRDWSGADFGPGGRCIETKHPFEVSVSFPMSEQGLLSMDVTLSQNGKDCPLSISVGNYAGMGELDAALAAGMTPIVSYWNSADMLWMDGKGMDGQGPCVADVPDACADSVKFYGFSVTPAFAPTTQSPEAATTSPPAKAGSGTWTWCIIGAFVGGGLVVLAMQSLALLVHWAVRKHRMRTGSLLPRNSSLLSATSSQNLTSLAESGGAQAAVTRAASNV